MPSKATTSWMPSGEVTCRCNPRQKGVCKLQPPVSQDILHSDAHINALAMLWKQIQATVCVGAANNPWSLDSLGR